MFPDGNIITVDTIRFHCSTRFLSRRQEEPPLHPQRVVQQCRVSAGTTVFRGIVYRTHDVGSTHDVVQASAPIRYGLDDPRDLVLMSHAWTGG